MVGGRAVGPAIAGRAALCLAALCLAALCLVAVAGCGFKPMYGGAASAASSSDATAAPSVIRDLAAIAVARIPNRSGQELRNELSGRLNPARLDTASRYTLNIDLRRDFSQLAIDRAGLATRGKLVLTGRYSLTDDASGRVILASRARSVVGFDILAGQPEDYFSTLVSTQDAQSRAIQQLAEQLTARLGAFFDSHPGGTDTAGPPASPTTEVEPSFQDESDVPLGTIGTERSNGGAAEPFGGLP